VTGVEVVFGNCLPEVHKILPGFRNWEETRKAVKARRYLRQGYWFDTACPTKTNKRKFWVRFKL